jgi:hypothetical protein
MDGQKLNLHALSLGKLSNILESFYFLWATTDNYVRVDVGKVIVNALGQATIAMS